MGMLTLEQVEKPLSPFPEETRLREIMSRDDSSDGVFVFAVHSTGVYCKPSCPARRPRRKEIAFFDSPEIAEQAGFRPCLRCRPRDVRPFPQTELVETTRKYIEANLESRLTLSMLSAHVGLSRYHFQRKFKRLTGISPREYIEAQRLSKFKLKLKRGEPVNEALYKAGFSSRSRLYEKASGYLGTTPGTYRRGGQGLRMKFTTASCPLGSILIAATNQGVSAVCFGDSDAEAERAFRDDYPKAEIVRDDNALNQFVTVFLDYFAGEKLSLNLPLDLQATAFQRRVWKAFAEYSLRSESEL